MPVRVAPVGDAHDEYYQYILLDLVEDAVVPDPEAAKTPQVTLERVAGERMAPESIDGGGDSGSIRLVDTFQIFGCASLNSYREAHV